MKRIRVAIVCLIIVAIIFMLGVALCPAHEVDETGYGNEMNALVVDRVDKETLMSAYPAVTETPHNSIIDDARETVKVLSNWVIDGGVIR